MPVNSSAKLLILLAIYFRVIFIQICNQKHKALHIVIGESKGTVTAITKPPAKLSGFMVMVKTEYDQILPILGFTTCLTELWGWPPGLLYAYSVTLLLESINNLSITIRVFYSPFCHFAAIKVGVPFGPRFFWHLFK